MADRPAPAAMHRPGGDARIGCDVVVVGGGMAGTAAAIAAARTGASVILVERHGFLGGAATAGSVGQFVGWETRSGRRVVEGIAADIVSALQAAGGTTGHGRFIMSTGHVMDRVEYDPELLKLVLDALVAEPGVQVLFHSVLCDCVRDGDRVAEVVLGAPSGTVRLSARSFVDASGDLALLTRAGADFLPLEQGDRLQPATMMFAMAPVDFAVLDGITPAEKEAIIRRGLEAGILPRAALHYSRVPGTDTAWFNVTRVDVEADDPFSLGRAEAEGRRQAFRVAAFLQGNLPGCGSARLARLAPQLGVRDSRRVAGDHVITVDDLVEGRGFPDTVCCGAYPIDIHHPGGDPGLTIREFGEDHFYRVPYRALIPQGLANVLAAGRGASATHAAFAALRVMPLSMAMGHAAGLAAALAARGSAGDIRRVDIDDLQGGLRRQNAFLGN